MTQVNILDGGRSLRITAEGHAAGSPAACAAVSALLYALGGWLRNRGGPDVTVRLEPGSAELYCPAPDAAACAAFETAAVGLMQVAAAQPEQVRVKSSDALQAENGKAMVEWKCGGARPSRTNAGPRIGKGAGYERL